MDRSPLHSSYGVFAGLQYLLGLGRWKADAMQVIPPTLTVDKSIFFHLQKVLFDLFW